MNSSKHSVVSDFFERRLRPVVTVIHRQFLAVILAAVLITVVALYLLVGGLFVQGGPILTINTDLSSLLPHDYRSVQALDRMREKVPGIDKLEILIQSDSFGASLRFAETLVPALLELRNPATDEPFIGSVEYRNDIEFFERNQLLLVGLETLRELQVNVERQIEEEKNKINPLFVDDLFGAETSESSGDVHMSLEELESRYDSLIPNEYLATDDGSVLMVRCFPFGTTLDLPNAQSLYAAVQSLIVELRPPDFHPSMFVELGGEVRNRVEEYEVITTDAIRNLLGGMIVQVLLITFFFRQPLRLKRHITASGKMMGAIFGILRQLVAAAMIAIPLVLSIIWTFGITSLVIGGLNTITVFLFVILFGMGIDFGIHTYSRYLEARLGGADILTSLRTTIEKTGASIFTAAVTTAAAFYALMVADFKGFSDFGFIAGTGILSSMVAMLFLLPAFITLGEKLGIVGAVRVTLGDVEERNPRPLRNYRLIVVSVIATIVVVAPFLGNLSFEYDFRDLRANLPELQGVKAKIHDLRMEAEGEDLGSPAVILADSREELNELATAVAELQAADTVFPTIAKVETIFDRFPQDQEEKLAVIRELRETIDDEGLTALEGDDRARLLRLRAALDVDSPFTLEQVPLSVKRRFLGKDNSIGEFMFIYPGVLLRDGKNSIEFARDLRSLSTMDGIETESGKTYYASSSSIIAADMLLLMQRDSEIAIVLTGFIVILSVAVAFRSIRRSLFVLSPLVVGFFTLWAIQLVLGMKYNLYNMVMLPVIIGYGVDGGVHMVHRYYEEGIGSLRRVIRTTGWAVVMTTATTCAGFGGLMFVRHGGLQSMGRLAVLGLILTTLASLLFLPAALQWSEQRDGQKTD
jgi:predicted RND superfamily exporter protein